MNSDKYLNFPLPILKEFDLTEDSKKGIKDIFNVGIYLYSQTLSGTDLKKYRDSAKFLHIIPGNLKRDLSEAQILLNKLKGRNYPLIGIKTKMVFDYQNNPKTEDEWINLCVFLAIRSILGNKPYCKTNKAMIHARMFGYNKPDDLPNKLNPLQEKFKKRYPMDKVLDELEINWHLKRLWNHNRGFYLSFDLSLKELAEISEDNKFNKKKHNLRLEKQKAIHNAKSM